MLYDMRFQSPDDPVLMVYRDRVRLNRAGALLLGLNEMPRVSFKTDDSGHVYIGSRSFASIKVNRTGGRYTITSVKLARKLASMLDGPGTYRIEQETSDVDHAGMRYYLIFWRKYEASD